MLFIVVCVMLPEVFYSSSEKLGLALLVACVLYKRFIAAQQLSTRNAQRNYSLATPLVIRLNQNS